ncbi:Tat pathway signal sequence domain protein [Halochromatium salexigens]|uniref:Tat pathway signal sequence domain protein n=1 Tax=Halochromatium salexigens TaxID=49447 RepID=A0AAJ0UFD8_HALSE|nr:Tat pathway signal sequence domain protein [Halochromatium salexigens]MBK5930438.1 hypothetical protein [Halochromatium salexigens]
MSTRTLQWSSPRPPYLRAFIAGIAIAFSLPLSTVAETEPSTAARPAEQPSAEDPVAPEAGNTERLGIELNKLEQVDDGCRVYLVFENALGTKLEALQLELILFDTEGFIKRRLTLDAAPIDEDKTSVKLFDLAKTQCEQVGRILINDVLAMAGPDGALPNEASGLALSSKLDVDLFK